MRLLLVAAALQRLQRLAGPRRPAAPRRLSSLLSSDQDDVCSTAPCSQNCTASGSIYQCSCFEGYTLVRSGEAVHGECIDIDECAVNNGNCTQVCVNDPGSYHCECAPGFESANSTGLNGTNGTTTGNSSLRCADIDECLLGSCAHDCENFPGSFQCSCRPGFFLQPDHSNCSDIDECAQPGVCNHFCNNHIGSFECGCFHGYAMSAHGVCEDIDECLNNNGGCDHQCHNNDGGHFCTCGEGFKEVFGRCLGPPPTPPPESWPQFVSRRLFETGRNASFHALTGPGAGVTTQPGVNPGFAEKLEPVHAPSLLRLRH